MCPTPDRWGGRGLEGLARRSRRGAPSLGFRSPSAPARGGSAPRRRHTPGCRLDGLPIHQPRHVRAAHGCLLPPPLPLRLARGAGNVEWEQRSPGAGGSAPSQPGLGLAARQHPTGPGRSFKAPRPRGGYNGYPRLALLTGGQGPRFPRLFPRAGVGGGGQPLLFVPQVTAPRTGEEGNRRAVPPFPAP